METEILTAEIPPELAGQRLDQALAEIFPDFSRSKLQAWIKAGLARVDGAVSSSKHKVFGGEQVELHAELEELGDAEAQDIPLTVVYEDEAILIVDKPAGLVVHPAAGHPDGTLQNALLHHAPQLATVPRAGIVHRIDKDTSGLLMVAKTLRAHKSLVDQLQERSIHREYLALAQGYLTAGGTVDAPIGRHPRDRKRYAVREDGKEAVTHYRIAERLPGHTLLRVKLETGRTHQIRVHMAYLHHPLLGDPVYGGRLKTLPGGNEALAAALRAFKRQGLHAETLGLEHPDSGEWLEWQSDLPADMAELLDALRAAA
ncbi:23S rRNA pseudouridine(1911/1915/1917) synthase RluD [Methylococcus sp. EFPC2]|uniref:23S rRNA pseudouridine(1911/1915/1917) synthase RluD n=1 Tax=Methylococcus sp. EFPC2 TaxID=2812648 RepID=UPI001968A1A9|nr:23S rRNA pseudouridine(1911/1915/1917) synthase RluD [Methylococcus sp. EFPC2]QSA96294.1 23S rRNA pseudouridine(1911/1915/1917) synthase RluD [Methylococcus sp. EFPC2]